VDDRKTETERMLREATTDRLEQSRVIFKWVTRVAFVAVFVLSLLGIWLSDLRWYLTAALVALVWFVASASNDRVRQELRPREEAAGDDHSAT
jgi:fatty acid desaturase